LYWQFQERFVQLVPAIPLYYPVYTYVVNSRIRGIQLGPLNDFGDRFQGVTGWYIKTEKVILDRSRPASRSGDSR
jgi:peptide/nickel transport system substrate-binding protein